MVKFSKDNLYFISFSFSPVPFYLILTKISIHNSSLFFYWKYIVCLEFCRYLSKKLSNGQVLRTGFFTLTAPNTLTGFAML